MTVTAPADRVKSSDINSGTSTEVLVNVAVVVLMLTVMLEVCDNVFVVELVMLLVTVLLELEVKVSVDVMLLEIEEVLEIDVV